jgi:hypothetical protein
MHSGSNLTGSLCKCMDCARSRYNILVREARLRYRDEYRAIEDDSDAAEQAIIAGNAALTAARFRERCLIDRVREEIASA